MARRARGLLADEADLVQGAARKSRCPVGQVGDYCRSKVRTRKTAICPRVLGLFGQ